MSERAERFVDRGKYHWFNEDAELYHRIHKLLGSPKHVYPCDCDAVYFDCSVLPPTNCPLTRDAYLIYGVTEQGTFISKWIDRWELDSDDEPKVKP